MTHTAHRHALPRELEDAIYRHRMTLAALSSSLVSTVVGFPLDSIKSRLQVKKYSSVLDCVKSTFREEGFRGYFRGIGIPLVTITAGMVCRTCLKSSAHMEANLSVRTTSFSIYDHTKKYLRRDWGLEETPFNVAAMGFTGIATNLSVFVLRRHG